MLSHICTNFFRVYCTFSSARSWFSHSHATPLKPIRTIFYGSFSWLPSYSLCGIHILQLAWHLHVHPPCPGQLALCTHGVTNVRCIGLIRGKVMPSQPTCARFVTRLQLCRVTREKSSLQWIMARIGQCNVTVSVWMFQILLKCGGSWWPLLVHDSPVCDGYSGRKISLSLCHVTVKGKGKMEGWAVARRQTICLRM